MAWYNKSWIVDGRWLKILIPQQNIPFWNTVKLAVDRCKSELYLVLILCTSELDLNRSLFLTTNSNKENIYWDWTSKIFNFLNNSWQESTTTTRIHSNADYSFLNFKYNFAVRIIPPENHAIWYNRVNISKIDHS